MWWISLLVAMKALAADVDVEAVTASSTKTGSGSARCVLDSGCKDAWTPGLKGTNDEEGIQIRLEKEVEIGGIAIEGDGHFALSVNGNRLANLKEEHSDGKIQFHLVNQDGSAKIPFAAKSLYVAVEGKTGSIRRISLLGKDFISPLSLSLPRAVSAKVSASSVLEPKTAFHPNKLFDHRIDLAWASDGKKTDGRGARIEVEFTEAQNIATIAFWNGYQRSKSHFEANSRVKSIEVKSDQGEQQTYTLADEVNKQVLHWEGKKSAKKYTFTVKEIYPGSKYKDLVLSEVQFRGAEGLLALSLKAPPIALPGKLGALTDETMAATFFPNQVEDYKSQSFVFRNDGTFKSVTAGEDAPREIEEGNWTPIKNGVKVFGRRYSSYREARDYSTAENKSASDESKIFQAELTIEKLSAANEKQTRALLRQSVTRESEVSKNYYLVLSRLKNFNGNDPNKLVAEAYQFLKTKDSYLLRSSLYNGIVVSE